MTRTADTEEENKDPVFNYHDLWQQKNLVEDDYWFLRTEYGDDVLQVMLNPDRATRDIIRMQELSIISMPSIIVTVEAGVGSKNQPILILEMGFRGSVRNWTHQLCMEASLTMQMGYYNSKLALWEPLIEPAVRNFETYVPWELKFEMSMNPNQDVRSSMSPISESGIDLNQPLMSINITSEKNIELTVTRTLLENLKNLGKAFASAIDTSNVSQDSIIEAPFKIINELGEDVTLLLGESSFELVEGGSINDINKSAAVPLQLKTEIGVKEKLHFGTQLSMHSLNNDHYLNIKVNDKNCNLTLPVVRADKKFFPLNYRSSSNDNWGIVCDIQAEQGVTIITLRSILQVHNHFNKAIDVYYMTAKGNELEFISSIQPKNVLNVPLKAVYNPTNELFFAISGYSVSCTPFTWKDLQNNITVTKLLNCPRKDTKMGNEPFFIKAVGEMEQVYYEDTNRHTISSVCYNIHLRPAVNFKNCLPFHIIVCTDELAEEFTVQAGNSLQLPNVEPGNNFIVIRLPQYLDREWSCRHEIVAEPEEFSVWSFHSYDSPTMMTLDLGMHVLNKNGSSVMTLYCPFWMLNKTGLLIAYRSSDENILHHPAHYHDPILFSFNAKNFFGKKKSSIRIESGDWSDKFSIDVAGSSGVVVCKWQEMIYQIGVHNNLTHNSLTKKVTFTPYYVIINEAPFPIDCQESDRPADAWITVDPKSCNAFWPKSEKTDKLMRIRVGHTQECTSPFLYTESHTTLLKLENQFGGINVDIQLTEGAVYINLAAYEVGCAPALLINHSTFPIVYWEKDSVQKR
ncbi:hypothetical protein JTB14_031768 [Gonioctena quinquepunctata]|nr:hypothetical protein JTB14_031768 [Gonioctena quinquepunctata]